MPEQTGNFQQGESYTVAVDSEDSSCVYVVVDGKCFPCPLSDGCAEYRNLNFEELKSAKKVRQKEKSTAKQAQSEAGAVATMEIQKIIDKAMKEVRHEKTVVAKETKL